MLLCIGETLSLANRVLLQIILLDGLIRIMILTSLLRIRERNGLEVMNLKVLIFALFFFSKKINFEKWIMGFNFVNLQWKM